LLDLKLDWCSFQAAKYACENWHYSKSIPCGKSVKIGVWEDKKFIGVVIFSCGASPFLLKKYGLNQQEGCELSRVALKEHKTPVTRIIKIAISLLLKKEPSLKIIISFADAEQDHLGIIYQAGNWVYTGFVEGTRKFLLNGKWIHGRSMGGRYKIEGLSKILETKKRCLSKYRYCLPLTEEVKKIVYKMKLPYPKKKCGNSVSSTGSIQESSEVQTHLTAPILL
jgi:hypothetical protein